MLDEQQAFAQIDKLVQEKMAAHQTPGLAIAITDSRGLLWESYYGLANLDQKALVAPQTLFEIGSIGKSFTALALLKLVEKGQLNLQTPVEELLPWLAFQTDFDPITTHHLLIHSAGLTVGVDFTPCARYETFALHRHPPAYQPGEKFHYSNVGYKLLGFLLEDVSRQPYGDLLQKWILDPLDMRDSQSLTTHASRFKMAVGYERAYDDRPWHRSHALVPAPWFEYGAGDGSPVCTARDLARYLRMLLSEGQADGARIVSPDNFERMMTKHVKTEQGHYGYALHLREVEGRRYFGHNGGTIGYRSTMLGDPDARLGVVIFVNGPMDTEKDAIAQYALRLLHATRNGGDAPQPPPKTDPFEVANASDYAGTYMREGQSLRFLHKEKSLILDYDGQQILLEQRAPDRFYVNHRDFALYLLAFERREDTVVAACHGPARYGREGMAQTAATSGFSHEWRPFVGHYRAHNPWFSNFRVFMRDGSLYLSYKLYQTDVEEPLFQESPGVFRVGADETSPEKIRFDSLINGRAERARVFGGESYRFFTP